MKVWQIISIYELDPIDAGPGEEPLKFRIEIAEQTGKNPLFKETVYRRESFRMQPTFPLDGSTPTSELCDHEIWVVDDLLDSTLQAASEADLLAAVLEQLRTQLGQWRELP